MDTNRTLCRYGLSTAGKAALWSATDVFSLYFLTDVARLPAWLAGGLFFVFMMWNALCDPFVGWYWDRRERSGGPSRRYYGIGAILTAVFFVLTFWAPLSGAVRIAFVLTCGLAFRAVFSAIDVPHNAMLAGLRDAGCCSVRLSVVRYGAATLAGMVAVAVVGLALKSDGASASPYFVFASIVLAAAGCGAFWFFLPDVSGQGPSRKVVPMAVSESAFRPVLIGAGGVLVGAALIAIITGIFFKNVPYIAKYLFGDSRWAVEALTVFFVGKLGCLGMLLSEWGHGQIRRLLFALLIATFAAGLMLLLPPSRLVFLAVLLVLGFTLGGINMLSWALLPFLADDMHRAGHGHAVTRLFGFLTALSKVGVAVSGIAMGYMLEVSDLAHRLDGGAAMYAYSGMLAVGGSVLALLCFALYRPRAGNRAYRSDVAVGE